MRAKVVHRDSLQVRREGASQIAFVGPPNAGKSSLLQALSHIQIKTGDYAFTTLRPVPALTRIGGVLSSSSRSRGLIEGAHEDRGGGLARSSACSAMPMRSCSAAPPTSRRGRSTSSAPRSPRRESRSSAILALTKADEVEDAGRSRQWGRRSRPSRSRSSTTRASIASATRSAPDWPDPGLPAPRRARADDQPFALAVGATVAYVADRVDHDVGRACTGALGWDCSPVRRAAGRARPRRRRRDVVDVLRR